MLVLIGKLEIFKKNGKKIDSITTLLSMHFKTEELIDTDSLLMYPFGPFGKL